MTTDSYVIWLYGSHARGLTDRFSDLDVLVVSEFQVDIDELRNKVQFSLDDVAVSHYQWKEIKRMAQYGSLFLHHIKLEGVPLFESPRYKGKLRHVLDGLGNYTFANRDVRGFQRVLEDVSESLNAGKWEIYEMAVLGTLIRHSSILGCWLLGQPQFGRHGAVNKFVWLREIEQSTADEFPDLYQYRLYIERGLEKPRRCTICPDQWLERAYEVIGSLSELVNAEYK